MSDYFYSKLLETVISLRRPYPPTDAQIPHQLDVYSTTASIFIFAAKNVAQRTKDQN